MNHSQSNNSLNEAMEQLVSDFEQDMATMNRAYGQALGHMFDEAFRRESQAAAEHYAAPKPARQRHSLRRVATKTLRWGAKILTKLTERLMPTQDSDGARDPMIIDVEL